MFNFNSTVSYGLRLLVNLAQENSRPKQLKIIAVQEGISLSYLRKLIPALEKAKIINSVKGPGGGFILARQPEKIFLLEVMSILSSNRVVSCLQFPDKCNRYSACLVKNLLQEVYAKIETVFKNKTLATILRNSYR